MYKVAITGHTAGLGLYLYNYYKEQGADVIGFSRSNGYDLATHVDQIVLQSNGVDLFINNAYFEDKQTELLKKLTNKVSNIVVCGSDARNYPQLVCSNENNYVGYKAELARTASLLSKSGTTTTNILNIDISFLEHTEFKTDNVINFCDIGQLIDFWISCPSISEVRYNWKMTDPVFNELRKLNEDNLKPLLQEYVAIKGILK
jgi:D-arabinose 1-dehydrogenase-like Zn-dependent alcohol dehydrogenase